MGSGDLPFKTTSFCNTATGAGDRAALSPPLGGRTQWVGGQGLFDRYPGPQSWPCYVSPPDIDGCFFVLTSIFLSVQLGGLSYSNVFKLRDGVPGASPCGYSCPLIQLANIHSVFARCQALCRITESVINYHYESYFKRETQEETHEGAGTSGFSGRVWLPFGESAPGVETSGLGDPRGSLPLAIPHSVMFFQAFTSE